MKQPVDRVRLQPVVRIRHHGARSAQVVAFVAQQRYAPVYNLAGAIDAWSQQVDTDMPRH
jgi:rhodanese-related sulfurtransferase